MSLVLIVAITAPGCGGGAASPREPAGDDLDVPVWAKRDSREKRTRAASPPPGGVFLRGNGKRYASRAVSTRPGGHIDVDFKNADLHNALRMLAEVGGVNLVIAEDVRGSVTLRLRRVPWDEAFEAIVAMKKLALTRRGSVWLVAVR